MTDLDAARRLATCATCGPATPVVTKGRNTADEIAWTCRNRRRAIRGGRPDRPSRRFVGVPAYRRLHLKAQCERCGFDPEDLCQLDVHHRDGDRSNNTATNLQTLCCNCHALAHRPRHRWPLAAV